MKVLLVSVLLGIALLIGLRAGLTLGKRGRILRHERPKAPRKGTS